MSPAADKAIIQAFAKLDKNALGVAVGILIGSMVFVATILLLLIGGDPIGPNMALLGQFFVGYTVSASGAIVGLLYGFFAGFVLGWLTALLRNFLIDSYLRIVKTRANLNAFFESLD